MRAVVVIFAADLAINRVVAGVIIGSAVHISNFMHRAGIHWVVASPQERNTVGGADIRGAVLIVGRPRRVPVIDNVIKRGIDGAAR